MPNQAVDDIFLLLVHILPWVFHHGCCIVQREALVPLLAAQLLIQARCLVAQYFCLLAMRSCDLNCRLQAANKDPK